MASKTPFVDRNPFLRRPGTNDRAAPPAASAAAPAAPSFRNAPRRRGRLAGSSRYDMAPGFLGGMVAWQAPRGQAVRVPLASVTASGLGNLRHRTCELWKLLGALQKLRAATWFVVIGRGVVSRNLHKGRARTDPRPSSRGVDRVRLAEPANNPRESESSAAHGPRLPPREAREPASMRRCTGRSRTAPIVAIVAAAILAACGNGGTKTTAGCPGSDPALHAARSA